MRVALSTAGGIFFQKQRSRKPKQKVELNTPPMRKLIYGINITLDGCIDHTKGAAGDDVHEFFAQLMHETDTVVYGRTTYELMVPFWSDFAENFSGPPNATNEFAKAFDDLNNIVVFSKTLEAAGSENTTILRGNLKEEILKLKLQPGKSIMTGGVSIPSQLMKIGLIDEYIFVVQPVIVGVGRRLFDHVGLPERLDLKLVETMVLVSGSVVLHYAKQE